MGHVLATTSSWKILIITFITYLINHFVVVASQQYSAPILSPSSSGGGPYFFNSSSFHSPRPGHLHPGPGHPLSLLSQYEEEGSHFSGEGSVRDESGAASSSSFAGSGFPPSRLPPGESHYPSEVGRPVESPGLDFENHGHSQQIPTSKSKTISGDYCWDPLFGCDTPRTILYCINGRCTCPTEWTLTPGNLPLNTVWEPSSKRCVSLLGSGCHVSPSTIGNGYVYCQPGVQCIPHPQWREVGTCGASSLRVIGVLLIFIVLILQQFVECIFNL